MYGPGCMYVHMYGNRVRWMVKREVGRLFSYEPKPPFAGCPGPTPEILIRPPLRLPPGLEAYGSRTRTRDYLFTSPGARLHSSRRMPTRGGGEGGGGGEEGQSSGSGSGRGPRAADEITDPSSSGGAMIQEEGHQVGTKGDWDSIRRSWLERPSKAHHTTPSSSTIDPSHDTDQLNHRSRRIQKLDRLIQDYDHHQQQQQSQENPTNPKAILGIIHFADRLTNNRKQPFLQPIPLSQAVSVLYRSWFHDGTIPDSIQFSLQPINGNDSESERSQ